MSRLTEKVNHRTSLPPYEKWLEDIKNRNKDLQKNYKRNIGLFLDFIESSPVTFIGEIEKLKEEGKNNTDINDTISDLASEYMNARIEGRIGFIQLQDGSYRPTKATTADKVNDAISSFLNSNGIEYTFTNREDFAYIKDGKKKLRHNEIRQVIDATGNLRNKTIIMIGKDTGLRAGDIANMRMKHIRPVITDNKQFHAFEIVVGKTKKKTGEKAICCVGPETTAYIRMWVKDRSKYGISNEDEDYLFCTLETKPGYTDKNGRLVKSVNTGDQLRSGTITKMFIDLKKKVGITRNVSFHSLRKFNQSNLEDHIAHNVLLKMHGRKGKDSSMVYSDRDCEEIEEKVKEVYSYIAIYGYDSVEELRSLQNRVKELEELNRYYFEKATEKLTLTEITDNNGNILATPNRDITEQVFSGKPISLEDELKKTQKVTSKEDRMKKIESAILLLTKEFEDLKGDQK